MAERKQSGDVLSAAKSAIQRTLSRWRLPDVPGLVSARGSLDLTMM